MNFPIKINLSTSSRIARFGSGGSILRSPHPLDDEQILQAVPSVFADGKHDSRSERYTHIPTSDVLKALRGEGFMPYEVRQGGSRDEMKRGFTKHLMRFRKEGSVQVGDSLRELVLINSHDGTSAYKLMSGMFRLVCSNGLVVADGQASTIRIPHKGDVVGQVIEGAYQIIQEGELIDQSVASMRQIELRDNEQLALANSALTLRYGEESPPIEASQLLTARRVEDRKSDLWTTFNRIQENMIRGGIRYDQTDDNGRRVARRHTRPVNSIDGNVNLNRALWQLAASMEQLKTAA